MKTDLLYYGDNLDPGSSLLVMPTYQQAEKVSEAPGQKRMAL